MAMAEHVPHAQQGGRRVRGANRFLCHTSNAAVRIENKCLAVQMLCQCRAHAPPDETGESISGFGRQLRDTRTGHASITNMKMISYRKPAISLLQVTLGCSLQWGSYEALEPYSTH